MHIDVIQLKHAVCLRPCMPRCLRVSAAPFCQYGPKSYLEVYLEPGHSM